MDIAEGVLVAQICQESLSKNPPGPGKYIPVSYKFAAFFNRDIPISPRKLNIDINAESNIIEI